MVNDFLILMKQELVITIIIFILLFVKLSKRRNEKMKHCINFVNVLIIHQSCFRIFFISNRELYLAICSAPMNY